MRTDRMNRSGERGFTLIELLVVVTIVGILAGLAMVNVRNAQIKAKEEVLRGNLHQLRTAIDNYYADKQKYPASLQDLVPNYLRRIPPDPITESSDTWIEIFDQPSFDDPGAWDSGGWDSPGGGFGEPDAGTPGVIDVQSGAEGETLDGTPYEDL
ncbi:MAG: type II secretion system protein [Thermoanaerobaculia bacterium]|nr:type II secretion system protein [Thermoanaerobaculia bacterium]